MKAAYLPAFLRLSLKGGKNWYYTLPPFFLIGLVIARHYFDFIRLIGHSAAITIIVRFRPIIDNNYRASTLDDIISL
jgi:hypothetical protein